MPGVEGTVVDVNLNWQRPAKVHEAQVSVVAEADMATGDPATSLFLGAVANFNKLPYVSVQVFAGEIGALISTSLPERDRPFALGRTAYLAWCDTRDVKPPEFGPGRYDALAEDGTPICADDAAITTTAGHAARVVLDVLYGKPAPIGQAGLLVGYAREWLFDQRYGQAIWLDVGPRSAEFTPGEHAKARDIATKLFKKWLSEIEIDPRQKGGEICSQRLLCKLVEDVH